MILKTVLLTNKKNLFSIFLLLSIFNSCGVVNNHDGVYVAVFTDKAITTDTLIINKNGTYKHIIYDKDSDRLVNINTGTWERNGDRLLFNDFLFNEDDIYYDYRVKSYDKLLINSYLSINPFTNNLIINYDLGFYYKKIK